MKKKDRWLMELPLLRRASSAVMIQRAEDYEGGDSGKENREDINSERKKSEKEGKISPFISPSRIKSRPLDHAQRTSTAEGSETRSTVRIRGLFRNLNQWSRSQENETSYTLMMGGVLSKH